MNQKKATLESLSTAKTLLLEFEKETGYSHTRLKDVEYGILDLINPLINVINKNIMSSVLPSLFNRIDFWAMLLPGYVTIILALLLFFSIITVYYEWPKCI
jgi:hypothetical protein